MSRRFAPVSVIVLAGLVAAAFGWYIAAVWVPEDFLGIIRIAAGMIGLWAGMFFGVVLARKLFPDTNSADENPTPPN